MSNISFPKIPLPIVIFLMLLWPTYSVLFDFLRWQNPDEASFIGGARLLMGLEGAWDEQSRMTKPLVLIVPGLAEWAFNIHPKWTFIAQNWVCYCLNILVLWRFFWLLSKDVYQSSMALLMYHLCQPLAIFSTFVLSDMPGWLMANWIALEALILLETNAIFQQKQIATRFLGLGILTGLGLLCKESALIGGIFAAVLLLLKPNWAFPYKLKMGSLTLLGFVIILALGSWFSMQMTNDTIFKRVNNMWDYQPGRGYYNLSNWPQVYRLLDQFWVLVILGSYQIAKHWATYKSNFIHIALLITIPLGLLLLPAVYPFIVDRLIFLVAPYLLFIGSLALKAYPPRLSFALILLGGLLNIGCAYCIYAYQTKGLIALTLLLFTVVIGLAHYLNSRYPKADILG